MLCELCPAPAKKMVVYLSRQDHSEIRQTPMCDEHIQAEIMLGATNLSMVDFRLDPLPA